MSDNLPAVPASSDLDLPQGVLDLLVPGARDVALDVAEGLTLDDIERVILHVGAAEERTQALRWLVGGALTLIKSQTPQGEWTDLLLGVAKRVRRTDRTLRTWMVEAQEHYQLDLPKGANPTRRKADPAPELAAASSSDDVAVDPVDVEARPAASPGADVGAPGDGGRTPLPGGDRPAPVKAPEGGPSPTLTLTAEVVAAYDLILDVPAIILGQIAVSHAMKSGAVERRVQRANTDAAPKADRKGRDSDRTIAPPGTTAGCSHPKAKRQAKGWGTTCGDCGLLLTPAILAGLG